MPVSSTATTTVFEPVVRCHASGKFAPPTTAGGACNVHCMAAYSVSFGVVCIACITWSGTAYSTSGSSARRVAAARASAADVDLSNRYTVTSSAPRRDAAIRTRARSSTARIVVALVAVAFAVEADLYLTMMPV